MPLVASAAGARIQRTIGTAVVDSAVGEFVLVGHWTGQDVFQEGYVDVGVVHCKGHGGEQRQHFLAFRAISDQAAAFSVWASLRCLLPDALDDEAVARFYFLDDVADGTDIGIISHPLQIENPPAENSHAVLANLRGDGFSPWDLHWMGAGQTSRGSGAQLGNGQALNKHLCNGKA